MVSFLLNSALGFAFGFAFLFGLWRLLAGKPLKWQGKAIWFYMGIAFPVFVLCEVGAGRLHEALFGQRLWAYHIQPIHDGYTSRYNFAIWPLYGWHLYLCDQVLANSDWSTRTRSVLTGIKHAISGPVLEVFANVGMLLAIGRYYFYYFPDDLWHLTSVQVIPYYAATSLLFSWVALLLRRLQRDMLIGGFGYAIGASYLLVG